MNSATKIGALSRAARATLVPCAAACALVLTAFTSCKFDRADRWNGDPAKAAPPVCTAGAERCRGARERCNADGRAWSVVDDCPARGLVCAASLGRCAVCDPSAPRCEGQTIMTCNADGTSETPGATCDVAREIVCRQGVCVALCEQAERLKSNVGCEYWAADLDNANVGLSRNAAAQQFAVVVSNPQPDLTAHVVIEQDDSLPGEPPKVRKIAEANVLPLNLETFKLGPREVDGSPEGQFNTGTGTALTRHAYRVTSQIPIVAYQFNPLENFNVFSNDASLLKPVEALTTEPGTLARAYVVLGWPQTIAATDDPNTNFNPNNPINLRAFLTLIGTRSQTHVRVRTTTNVVPGGTIPATGPGGIIEATLEPFDVLNLETGGINADFTSSLIDADQPLVVFSGSEASDAPVFQTLAKRYCCADHLEQQLDPIRTAGKNFVLAHTPSRTGALKNAGAILGLTEEPEYFRIMAVSEAGAIVETSLPPPDDRFELKGQGALRELIAYEDVVVKSDRPITVGQ
ncbi:MAG: IgGFc-binding protein, partial [Polyangiaceae bacterium]